MKKAVIENSTGLVVNVIELNDAWTGAESEWQPPKNHSVIDALDCQPGDTWDGTSFISSREIITDAKAAENALAIIIGNRKLAYPPMADYLDAKVKQASSDPSMVAEGKAQEQDYLNACLTVKTENPKP